MSRHRVCLDCGDPWDGYHVELGTCPWDAQTHRATGRTKQRPPGTDTSHTTKTDDKRTTAT